MRDSNVARQCAEIKQLSRAPRAQSQEALKGRQVLHIQHLADIAFDICCHVAGKPIAGFDVLGVKRGVTPSP